MSRMMFNGHGKLCSTVYAMNTPRGKKSRSEADLLSGQQMKSDTRSTIGIRFLKQRWAPSVLGFGKFIKATSALKRAEASYILQKCSKKYRKQSLTKRQTVQRVAKGRGGNPSSCFFLLNHASVRTFLQKISKANIVWNDCVLLIISFWLNFAGRGCKMANHVLRCDVPWRTTRLIWAQSRVSRLILGLSRVTEKSFATFLKHMLMIRIKITSKRHVNLQGERNLF